MYMKNFINEFKAFIMRGNVVDLAVGVIIGTAFGKIVSALVDNVLMPCIGLIIGGKNFEFLSFGIGDAQIKYGMFISSLIDFVIIALVLFLIIRAMAKMSKKSEVVAASPVKSPELVVLEQIRDGMRK